MLLIKRRLPDYVYWRPQSRPRDGRLALDGAVVEGDRPQGFKSQRSLACCYSTQPVTENVRAHPNGTLVLIPLCALTSIIKPCSKDWLKYAENKYSVSLQYGRFADSV